MTNQEIHQRALLIHQDAEIKRLKAANTDLQRECMARGQRIADLERLITRAANALTVHSLRGDCRELIAELRKAAE